ncbi:MAG TPA: hypothetical protein VGK19_07655 [Capsulimonadaceae bacterium]|jgi:hypothetical protein
MKFKNNIPFIKHGLEVSQISFSGGRTAASLANHGGLTQLDYYGLQSIGDIAFYKSDPISAWSTLFRACVTIGDNLYYLEFNDTLIYPFGYSSHCLLGGVALSHKMILLNDAVVFSLDIVANPSAADITFKLIHTDTCARIDKPNRTWDGFTLDSERNAALASATSIHPDEPAATADAITDGLAKKAANLCSPNVSSQTWLGLVASSPLTFTETPREFRKYYFGAPCTHNTNTFALAFGHAGRDAFLTRLDTLRTGAAAEAEAAIADYRTQVLAPGITIQGHQSSQSLLNNAVPIIDSLKVKDIPGAIRAADSGYWVWGWDSMSFPEGLGLAGDTDVMRDMLDFYRRTADPEYGISHQMRLDERAILTMEFAAQCIYIVLLYHAYVLTGDRDLLDEYLPFAQWIIDKAQQSEIAGSGLMKSTSLYPDFPGDLEQDGNDISVFDNSIYYQALKLMAELSREIGDVAAQAAYDLSASRTCAGFQRFFDTEKGYFVDSLSSLDFSMRRHYPNYAILWLTPHAADLVKGNEKAIAAFMRTNFRARHGIRMFPKWDTRYMYDGNQLGMYMPVAEKFYREMMKIDRDSNGISELFDNIDWFWNHVSVLEALTCECENHGITLDNPGRKQAFAVKSWLNMFYQVAAGMNISTTSLTFTPCDSEEIKIKALAVRGKSVSVEISGRGWKFESVEMNGKPISAPYTIPYDSLKKTNRIVIKRRK